MIDSAFNCILTNLPMITPQDCVILIVKIDEKICNITNFNRKSRKSGNFAVSKLNFNNLKSIHMMPMNYEAVVLKCYNRMRGEFIQFVMNKFKASKMRLEDAEDIYQEIYIAICDNMSAGRIKENVSWNSYIMTIGLNMACKKYRKLAKAESCYVETEDENGDFMKADVQRQLTDFPDEQPDPWLQNVAKEILDRELKALPKKQSDLIQLHYLEGKKDEEIARILGNYSSGKSVKVVRNRLMKEFIPRVKEALTEVGYEIKEEKAVRA